MRSEKSRKETPSARSRRWKVFSSSCHTTSEGWSADVPSESQMKEWKHTCFSAVLRHNEKYPALPMSGGQTPVKRAKSISSAAEQLGKNDRDHAPLQI